MASVGNNLIGVPSYPDGFKSVVLRANEGLSYHEGCPYPYFSFQNWRTELWGPHPTPIPIPKAIANKKALWLFGKPIGINVLDNENVEEELRKIWNNERMYTRMTAIARRGSYEGSIVLMYVVRPQTPDKVTIRCLSIRDECQPFMDPHDPSQMLMLRIQYPYRDPSDQKYYWYREEWTDDYYVIYQKMEVGNYKPAPEQMYGMRFLDPSDDPMKKQWVIKSKEPNVYGKIPAVLIQNWETDGPYGLGDMWGCYRIMDRLNLAYNLMDRNNQTEVDPTRIFIDLEVDQDDLTRSAGPGHSISAQSAEDGEGRSKEGRVQLLESEGSMRGPIAQYVQDLKQYLYEATGAVFPRQEDVTNKGRLTQSVLAELYAPLIEVIQEQRKTYGDAGIALFLSKMAEGLKNAGWKEFKSWKSEEHEVTISWFNFFQKTEDEKLVNYDRISREFMDGLITYDIAIGKIAELEEISNPDETMKELLKNGPPTPNLVQQESTGTRGNSGAYDPNRQSMSSRTQRRGPRVRDRS